MPTSTRRFSERNDMMPSSEALIGRSGTPVYGGRDYFFQWAIWLLQGPTPKEVGQT